jgi:hypothetical protein
LACGKAEIAAHPFFDVTDQRRDPLATVEDHAEHGGHDLYRGAEDALIVHANLLVFDEPR